MHLSVNHIHSSDLKNCVRVVLIETISYNTQTDWSRKVIYDVTEDDERFFEL